MICPKCNNNLKNFERAKQENTELNLDLSCKKNYICITCRLIYYNGDNICHIPACNRKTVFSTKQKLAEHYNKSKNHKLFHIENANTFHLRDLNVTRKTNKEYCEKHRKIKRLRLSMSYECILPSSEEHQSGTSVAAEPIASEASECISLQMPSSQEHQSVTSVVETVASEEPECIFHHECILPSSEEHQSGTSVAAEPIASEASECISLQMPSSQEHQSVTSVVETVASEEPECIFHQTPTSQALSNMEESLDSIRLLGSSCYNIIKCFALTQEERAAWIGTLRSRSWKDISTDINRKSSRSFTDSDTPSFLDPVITYLRRIFQGRDLHLSALRMMPNNLPQILHVDYPKFHNHISKTKNYTGQVPYGAVFGIEENTCLWIYDKKTQSLSRIRIPVGCIMVFAGDVIHAGDCYDTLHYRMHLYIDVHKFSDAAYSRQNAYFHNIPQQPILYELAKNIKWTCKKFEAAITINKWKQHLRRHDRCKIIELLKSRDTIIKDESIDDYIKDQRLEEIKCILMTRCFLDH